MKNGYKRRRIKRQQHKKVLHMILGIFLIFAVAHISGISYMYAKASENVPIENEPIGSESDAQIGVADLPAVMDLHEFGFAVHPEKIENQTINYVQECISGNGAYYSRKNYFLTGSDAYGHTTKMYCIQPQKLAPVESTNYQEYQIYDAGSSTNYERAATLAVLMYGYGGYGYVNLPNFFPQNGSTQDGGSFGVYVVGDENSSRAVTGLMINEELHIMDATAARALTASTIHRVNGAPDCGKVTGYKLNPVYSSSVASAAETLYTFGLWAGEHADLYGLPALIDAIATDAEYQPRQKISFTVWSPSQNAYVELPQESSQKDFNWSPYLDSDRRLKIKVLYTASKMESKLIAKNPSGSEGKLTYSHERALIGLDGSQGYYDYITVQEGTENQLPVEVTYGPLLSSTKLSYVPGVKTPTTGIEFYQEVILTLDGAELIGGKKLDLSVASGNGATCTPIYGNGDLGDGSYYSARFFSSTKAQDVAFASPRQGNIYASASLQAEGAGGSIEIYKTSANQSITKDNSAYSLDGAVYKLYTTRADADGDINAIATLKTDKNGYARADYIISGTYYLKETISSKGYALDDTCYTIKVSGADTEEVPLKVTLLEVPQLNPIELVLYKVDKDNPDTPLAGAEYTVKYYKGEYKDDPALLGIKPEKSWVLRTSDGKDNPKNLGKVLFSEECKVSGDEFYLMENGSPALPLGTVTIQETKAPEGYHLTESVFVRQITGAGSAELVENYQYPTDLEQPIKQAFQIVKLGETKGSSLHPLADAGFMACRLDELDLDENGNYIWDEDKAVVLTEDGTKELFTDETGYAKSIPLFYGTYVVRETTVPSNYLPVEDFFVTVESDEESVQTLRYFEDKIFQAYLKIVKTDEKTGESILNNSAIFKIWSYEKQDYLSMRTYRDSEYVMVDEFSTNEKGELITPETLLPGRYRIDEIKCPENYYSKKTLQENNDLQEESNTQILAGGTDIEIDNSKIYESYVDENGENTDMGVFTLRISNAAVTGQLKIHKTGEIHQWSEESGVYEPEQIPLAGVTFAIYAADDIYSSDGHGTLLYEKDIMVETILTDEEGIAHSSNELPLGKYYVRELQAPERYELGEDFYFEVSSEGDLVMLDSEDGERQIDFHEISLENYKKIRIETTARDALSLTERAELNPEITVIDTVYLEGLEVGHEYTIEGIVMDKETEEPLLLDGAEIVGTTQFVAKETVQNVEVVFVFSTEDLINEAKEIVLYEYLFDEAYPQELIASHEDINEERQTIYIEPKVPDTPEIPDGPKTGDNFPILLLTILMSLSIAGIGTILWQKKQK